MWAICSSASKSLTARSPRMMWPAPISRQASTVRPANGRTSTRPAQSGSTSATPETIVSTRVATSSMGAFFGLTSTATTTRSKTSSERRSTSTCPNVIGSNDPG